MVSGQDSLYLTPEATYPFVPGHELVGRVVRGVFGERDGLPIELAEGDRVAVWPVLGCAARGHSRLCSACTDGWDGLCQRRNEDWPGRGIAIGFNRETGGGWSERCLACVSQLWRLPESVSDEDAVLADPAATALACLLRAHAPIPERTLVIGGGTVGLLVAYLHSRLRQPGKCEILVRHEYQREWATRRGITASLVRGRKAFAAWAADRSLSSTSVKGYGQIYRGIYDRVIVTAATPLALECAIHAATAGGLIVLAAAPARFKDLDLTPLWYREIKLRGILAYGPVLWKGEWVHPYQILIPRLADGTLCFSDLVTHHFPLAEHVAAFRTLVNRRKTYAIKVVFRP
jgi:threonine dehydrogenase-like Zn-dependent dehydrogenase